MITTLLRLQVVACIVAIPLALTAGHLLVGLWFVAALALGTYSLGRRGAPVPAPTKPTRKKPATSRRSTP